MVLYKLVYSKRFKKHYMRLHPTEKKQIASKVKLLSQNPMHPSLRTKRIQGTDLFECSVNMEMRIVWFYEEGRIIVLLEVGHHEILHG